MLFALARVGLIASLVVFWTTADFAQSYRQLLSSVATFFINANTSVNPPCNNNTTTCGPGSDGVTAQQALSPLTPFETINKALTVVTAAYDFGGFRPVFDLARGNYAGFTYSRGVVGFPTFKLRGDQTAPSAVSISCSAALAAVWVGHFVIANLMDFVITDQGDCVAGVQAHEWAGVDLQGINCGALNVSAFCIMAEGYAHIECTVPENGISSISVSGDMGGIVDLHGKAHWNCGESAPNTPAGYGTINILNPTTNFAIAGARSVGGGGLENMAAGTFVGAVSGVTGVPAILQGPGYMTTLPSGTPATCLQVFKWGSSTNPCQLSQGFHDDAGE